MECPRCRRENRLGAKFCEECAAPLARTCPKCGAQASATAKFCAECAHPLAEPVETQPRFSTPEAYTPKHLAERILTSKAALEGERKQVTVLFADLKGSMELLADRDPEEARKLLDPVLERMMEAVHRYEGTVNQVMGDGIMALFGAPVAHEDHAARACYAALWMQERVKQFAEETRRTTGIPVAIRVGLNSGEVVVRSIGSDLHMDYTAVGQTTHLAARMEQAALPGSTMITGGTLRLAEGYVQVKPLGAVAVKGMRDAIEAYELTGHAGARTRLQVAVGRGLTRFIGRDTELETLRRALGKAQQGQGQVIGVIGEPGVGKSRLFYEFVHSHRTHGWLVLESSSVSYGKATPYLPLTDLLKVYFQIQDRDDARKIQEKVSGKLITLDETLLPALPAFLALLDVPVDDPQWRALDPPERRERTLEACKRLVLRESRVQPLALVFEDLHWIDAETQAFLDGLVESLPTARLLLLVNYRPEYRHAWGSKGHYTQLRIDPLPPESAEELLDALLGPDATLHLLKRLLIERTEGNPLFLEESVRTLVETQVLSGERGAYRLTRDVTTIQVAPTVQAVLAARIDRLAPERKQLLQSAAVIGDTVPFTLLRAVTDLPENDLRARLADLQAAEFLYETSLFPDLEYTFKHGLTCQVAYGSLLTEGRRALHGRIGEAMERVYADRLAERYEKLAHHFTRAEQWTRVVDYSVLAGRRAEDAFANTEAKAHYARGLDAARHLGPAVAPAVTAGLHAKYAGSLVALTEYDAAIAEYQQALDLLHDSGERALEASILSALSVAHHRGHSPERALECNEQALALGRALGDRGIEARGLNQRAMCRYVWYGEVDGAARETALALDLVGDLENRRLRGQIVTQLGQLEQFQGDYRQGLGRMAEGLRLAEAERDWHLIAKAMFFTVTASAALGEYEEALRWYRRLHDYAFTAEDKFWMARTPNLAGGIHLELFDLEEANRLNLEGHEVAQRVYRWSEPRGHCLLKVGLAYLEMGDLGRATSFLDRTWALLDEDAWLRWRWQIPLLRARGALALARGHVEEAWDYASQSLEMATRTASRRHVARARLLQGEVLAAGGRLEEAARVLESSAALAAALGTPRELWMAKAGLGKVLARLGRDGDATTRVADAAREIEAIAAKLTTPRLRRGFLAAEPVVEVYRMLGHHPPRAE